MLPIRALRSSIRPLVACAVLAVAVTLAAGAGAQTVPDTTAPDTTAPDTTAPDTTAPEEEIAGLGGGASFPADSVVEMIAGQTLPPVNSIFVDNPGTDTAEVEFESFTDPGITITPDQSSFSLAPEERVDVAFAIAVAGSVAPGEYPVAITLKRVNVTEPTTTDAGGAVVTVLPGVTAKLTVRVVGEGASLTVRAVNVFDDSPIVGHFVLTWMTDTSRVVIADETNTEIKESLAPGRYHVLFEIEGFSQNEREVTLAAGDDKTEVFELETVSFGLVAAKPQHEEDRVVTADLKAVVTNQLGEIAGPITLDVEVLHDNEELETVELEKLPALLNGTTEFSEPFRPEAGWKPGTYRFVFTLVTPAYTIQSVDEPELTIEEPASKVPLIAALAAGAIVVVALIVLLVGRSRRNRQQRIEENLRKIQNLKR